MWANTDAFMSTITNKCDPDKRGNAVDAQAVAQEILCKAVNRYTEVHNEVKSAYSKMRSERNPCRINPKIKTRVYAHENSPYTFFGWRLGEMAEEGSLTVRTTKQCHICFFCPSGQNRGPKPCDELSAERRSAVLYK